MSTVPKRALTPQEYLVQERLAEFRSEYYHGEVVSMPPVSWKHSLIKANVASEAGNQLRKKPCFPFTTDLRVRIIAANYYVYPDIGVVCGKVECEDEHRDAILNPIMIAEIFSRASEANDRGRKFDGYRQIPSLREYLLISPDTPMLELRTRNSDAIWTTTIETGLDQSLDLPAIGVTLALAEVYDGIDFTIATPERPA
jgi:Uma2 family endonuclease